MKTENQKEYANISQKVINLMKDPAWIESADTFDFPVTALQPKPEFVPESGSKEEGGRE